MEEEAREQERETRERSREERERGRGGITWKKREGAEIEERRQAKEEKGRDQ